MIYLFNSMHVLSIYLIIYVTMPQLTIYVHYFVQLFMYTASITLSAYYACVSYLYVRGAKQPPQIKYLSVCLSDMSVCPRSICTLCYPSKSLLFISLSILCIYLSIYLSIYMHISILLAISGISVYKIKQFGSARQHQIP